MKLVLVLSLVSVLAAYHVSAWGTRWGSRGSRYGGSYSRTGQSTGYRDGSYGNNGGSRWRSSRGSYGTGTATSHNTNNNNRYQTGSSNRYNRYDDWSDAIDGNNYNYIDDNDNADDVYDDMYDDDVNGNDVYDDDVFGDDSYADDVASDVDDFDFNDFGGNVIELGDSTEFDSGWKSRWNSKSKDRSGWWHSRSTDPSTTTAAPTTTDSPAASLSVEPSKVTNLCNRLSKKKQRLFGYSSLIDRIWFPHWCSVFDNLNDLCHPQSNSVSNQMTTVCILLCSHVCILLHIMLRYVYTTTHYVHICICLYYYTLFSHICILLHTMFIYAYTTSLYVDISLLLKL